jgi:hypothetical protein
MNPRGSKRVTGTKLNIILEKFAFPWFVLCICVTIRGANNTKIKK